jgi:hypothetical protein
MNCFRDEQRQRSNIVAHRSRFALLPSSSITPFSTGEFNSRDVENTLWAYATMVRKPGERMMGQLEGRVEAISGEFNSRDVANTLWAYATMRRKPGERMMGQLEGRAEAISGEFNSQDVENTRFGHLRRWGESRGSG